MAEILVKSDILAVAAAKDISGEYSGNRDYFLSGL